MNPVDIAIPFLAACAGCFLLGWVAAAVDARFGGITRPETGKPRSQERPDDQTTWETW